MAENTRDNQDLRINYRWRDLQASYMIAEIALRTINPNANGEWRKLYEERQAELLAEMAKVSEQGLD